MSRRTEVDSSPHAASAAAMMATTASGGRARSGLADDIDEVMVVVPTRPLHITPTRRTDRPNFRDTSTGAHRAMSCGYRREHYLGCGASQWITATSLRYSASVAGWL